MNRPSHPTRLRTRSGPLCVLALAATVAVAGCALVGCGASGAGVVEGVELRTTVASVGLDAIEAAPGPETPGVESERRADAPDDEASDDAPTPPTVQVELGEGTEPDRVDVSAPDADDLLVRVGSVSVGEALVFLAGGDIVSAPEMVRLLSRAARDATDADARDDADEGENDVAEDAPLETTLDVTQLVDKGTGLLTVDSEARMRGEESPTATTRVLVQVSPLELEATPGDEGIVVELRETGGAAVRGARVEILDADGHQLAKGLTGRQGRATLVLPRHVEPTLLGARLFVVARHAGQHALITLTL